MKIGSKVLIKGSYFSCTYKGEIIGESEENKKPVWEVLVQLPESYFKTKLKSVKSSFFKDSLENVSSIDGNFYIEEEE